MSRRVTPSSFAFISVLLLIISIDGAFSFCPRWVHPCTISIITTNTQTELSSAMERLHDPSTNAYGRIEHVYSLREIGIITDKIRNDEWSALGSIIAENLLETILDVGDVALNRRGWVERTSITNAIAEGISSAVEVSLVFHLSR
jgi:hypothetical protein